MLETLACLKNADNDVGSQMWISDDDAHHVLVEEDIDGIGVVSIGTVVVTKLRDQKKDHRDHKLRKQRLL